MLSRRILFKGRRTDTGEWVEGRLLADDVIIPTGQEFEVYGGYIEINSFRGYIVDPETVEMVIRERKRKK